MIFQILAIGVAAHALVFNGTEKYEATSVYTGLNRPWAVTYGPDQKFYITELDGNIRVLKNNRLVGSISGIPSDLEVSGQGGLMDLVFHPNFSRNNFVYISYTTKANANPVGGRNTRVSRFKLINNRLSAEKILTQGGYGRDSAHFGCRLAFGHGGKLYATFGERHNKEKAQSLEYLNGKVVRLNDDGTIPKDNPFVGVFGAREEIYTIGHRNPQGIDIHPGTGNPVISEHGPSGYDAKIPGHGSVGKADEVNWLLKGRNYGWPTVFGDPSILPWSPKMHQFARTERIVMPVKEFTVPDGIAPSGASFYTGNKFPLWKGSFFVAALRGYLIRMSISNSGKLVGVAEKVIPNGFSRIRDVSNGPDGFLYAISARGNLIEIKPSGNSVTPPPGNTPPPSQTEIQALFQRHNCTSCHMELDDLENLPATWVDETDAKESELYKRVASTGPGRMPLNGPSLSEAEKKMLLNWLENYIK